MLQGNPFPLLSYSVCAVLAALTASQAIAAQVPAGSQLATKQEIVRHIKDEPASLDPAKVVGLPEAQVARDLFEGLVNQDATGKNIPGVAESWQNQNNQVFLFTLRKDAKWSNGDPVTAQDFVYSWQRLVDPKGSSSGAWFAGLAGIANADAIIAGKMPVDKLGVTAVSPTLLRVTLDKTVP